MSTFIPANPGQPQTAQPASRLADVVLGCVVLAAAALIGVNAWSQMPTTVAVLLLPVLMNQVKVRFFPYMVAVAYFASAAVELPGVIARFFPDGQPLAVSWGAPALLTLIQALPFLIYNPRGPGRQRAFRMVVALVLLTVPPIGLLAWMNPLFAAGVLFPGTGYGGLLLATATLAALAAAGDQAMRRPVFIAAAAILACSIVANEAARRNAPEPMHRWMGVDTTLEPAALRDPMQIRSELPGSKVGDMAAHFLNASTDVIVFPESVFDPLTAADRVALTPQALEAKRQGIVILAGAVLPDGTGGWRNTLMAFGASEGVVAEARVPMPMGNWRLSGGVTPRPFASDLALVETRHGPVSAAVSICYEDTLIWPHFGLLSGRAVVLVSAGNAWATGGTRGDRTQQVSVHLLARLAGVPLVRAQNKWDHP